MMQEDAPVSPLSSTSVEADSMSVDDEKSGCSHSRSGSPSCGVTRETLIFLDWDDTLLPSSFLSSRGFRLDSGPLDATTAAWLAECELSVVKVLRLAVSQATVCIVTNAEKGWVELSAQKWMPRVHEELTESLSSGSLKIVSARTTYEPRLWNNPLQWKILAFQEELKTRILAGDNPEVAKHIISLGDSHVEREAVRTVTRNLVNTKTKSVKFAERPSIEQLRRQLELVQNCFDYIHGFDGDLDLMLTISLMYSEPQQQPAEDN